MTTISTDTHTKLVLNRLFGQGLISCKIRNILNRELIEKVEKLSKVQMYGYLKDARTVQSKSKSKLYQLVLDRYYNELVYNFDNINVSCKYDLKNEIYNNLCENWSPTSESMNNSNERLWVYISSDKFYKLLVSFNLDDITIRVFVRRRDSYELKTVVNLSNSNVNHLLKMINISKLDNLDRYINNLIL